MKPISFNTILLIALAVFVVLYLNSFFGCNHNDSYKYKLELNDSLRSIDKRQIEADKIQLAQKDTIISNLTQQVDSVISNISKHQVVYKPIYEQLKNIPIRIDRIRGNDDAIRNALSTREQD